MPILIVDDNEQNLKLARVALECEGFDVRTATDGEAAIEMLRTVHPRLILMDVQLPGLDGLEVARRLKADPATRDILIIAVTAYAMKGDRERAMSAGCDGYIAKPLDPILLPGQLGEYLGGLPVRPTPNPRAVAPPVGEEAVGDGRAPILVIEDNPTTRKMFRISLESAGHRVLEAHDARSALAAVALEAPALIIQDLNLPDMDGLDLAHSLREQLADKAVPIVCVSGFLSRIDEARAAESGFAQVLVKPVDPLQLLDVAKLHLTRFPSVAARYGQGQRVLVVDDDPLQLKLSQIWLSAAGFAVTLAEDGRAALELARLAPPNIVVADVLMPRLDGFGLCLALRSDPVLGQIPVILRSAAYIDPVDRELATRVGASDMVAKADGLEAVMTAVSAALLGSPPSVPTESPDVLAAERAKRGLWQLERQVLENSRLRQRTAQQEAQLAVLAGVAESLARNRLDGAVLGDALASCLDMAGISKGALFIAEHSGRLVLQHQIGFATIEEERLRVAFGYQELFAELANRGQVVRIPSELVADAVAQALLIEAGTTSLLLVPVSWGTQMIGAMLLGARIEDISGEDALAFARVLGAQMGQAIGLSRSFANLAASEERYRTLTENANDSIVILSLDGHIRESNRRFSDALGYSPEELLGRHIRDLAAPGSKLSNVEAFDKRVLAGPGRSSPVELQRKDGTLALMEFSNATVDVAGESLVLTIGRDVSDQVRAQAQLMVSDRMASVGALAAGVAHEINNPLAAVTVNLELALNDVEFLAAEPGASSRVRDIPDILRDARDAAGRVRQIVRDLKIFSRTEEDERAAVDLLPLLDSTLRMAWNEIRHRATLVKRYGKTPLVDGSESRLGQVFLNLVINAAQAIPEGHVDRNQITITTGVDAKGNVVTEVRDTGPGIEPAILKRLFTPFFTTKAAGVGTGLGLTICQRIITSLGGEITVASKVGEGTVFRVVLPPARLKKSDKIPLPSVTVARRRGRVLLLDDEPMMGTAVSRTLGGEHDVRVVTNGRDALDMIAAGSRFDVILCDLMMPMMTGVEFHHELTQSCPDQAERIVFLTGGAFTATARAFLDEVSNLQIEKPFHVQDLRALVNDRVR